MNVAQADPEVLFEQRGRAGLITLNRPKALNALNRPMCEAIYAALDAWKTDPAVERVVIRGAGPRAFCAGGDVRAATAKGPAGIAEATRFFHAEYRLNTFIKRYPKPYVALIHGVMMGGGVGLSVHGSHRAVGESVTFAMPEMAIGLFPDVGGTYVLPRLAGALGTYIALAGARLGQADLVATGLATHAIREADFDAILAGLATEPDIDAVLARHAVRPEGETLPPLREAIDRCFAADTVEDILARLDAETGQHAAWAAETAANLRSRSPTSLKIALRQMRIGGSLSFEDAMRTELRMVHRVLQRHDFYEGVRAVLVDRDNKPRWQPATLADVSAAEVDTYFQPNPDAELKLP